MDKKVLSNRFKKLGWKMYKLAEEVSKIRASLFGEDKKAASLVTSVALIAKQSKCSQLQKR